MEWTKFTERECDLFTAYCIMMGYLKNYRKNIGKNLKNFLMIHQNGIIHSWRLKNEYNEFLNELKTKKLDIFEKILDKLKNQNEKLKIFLKYRFPRASPWCLLITGQASLDLIDRIRCHSSTPKGVVF